MFKSFFRPVTKRFVERRVLETHPMHLFRIIQDVDAYAEFLPLCSHSKILKVYNGGRTFEATLSVGLPWGPGLQETYVSQVQVQPEIMTIETTSIESQFFDSLKSTWKLRETTALIRDDDGTAAGQEGKSAMAIEPFCDVDFEVEMTVRDPAIAQILDRILKTVAQRQVEAFDQRCKEISLPEDIQAAILRNNTTANQKRQ